MALHKLILLLHCELLFSLQNSFVQDLEKIFASLKDVLVDFLSLSTWHVLVPQVHDDQDILYSHLLQLRQQFFATSLFVPIVKSFDQSVFCLV